MLPTRRRFEDSAILAGQAQGIGKQAHGLYVRRTLHAMLDAPDGTVADTGTLGQRRLRQAGARPVVLEQRTKGQDPTRGHGSSAASAPPAHGTRPRGSGRTRCYYSTPSQSPNIKPSYHNSVGVLAAHFAGSRVGLSWTGPPGGPTIDHIAAPVPPYNGKQWWQLSRGKGGSGHDWCVVGNESISRSHHGCHEPHSWRPCLIKLPSRVGSRCNRP